MKKYILSLMLASSLMASSGMNSFHPGEPTFEKLDNEEILTDKNFRFNYLAFGATAATEEMIRSRLVMADLFFGHRHGFASGHAFDGGVGICAGPSEYSPILYGQFSYLFYPAPPQGIYIGLGIAINWMPGETFFWPNIPATLGYQFPKTKQFIQVQATPLRSATIHYGFGF